MIKYLDNNDKIGTVALPRFKEPKTHIDIGCMLWKTDLLSQITWKYWNNTMRNCPCKETEKEIIELGYKICYYPSDELLVKRVN